MSEKKVRVIFLFHRAVDGDVFEEGKEYSLVETSAQRWIRRGVAVEVKAERATRKQPETAVVDTGETPTAE